MTLKEKLELLLNEGNDDLSNVEIKDRNLIWTIDWLSYTLLTDDEIIFRIKEQK